MIDAAGLRSPGDLRCPTVTGTVERAGPKGKERDPAVLVPVATSDQRMLSNTAHWNQSRPRREKALVKIPWHERKISETSATGWFSRDLRRSGYVHENGCRQEEKV